ncbi:MAG: flavoprotein [Pseudarthrobacter sp.]|nr:flavoprotein [Pseudarthrobacter sp.]
METTSNLPIAVIGAGPVGLAAAAHLLERGLEPVIFEAGPTAGWAIGQWRHIRLFSPWRFNLDAAAVRLLDSTGWESPRLTALPSGGELIDSYLAPLAALPEIKGRLQTSARVLAVTRQGMDKTHVRHRDETPFIVRVEHGGSEVRDHIVGAVVDASGTWSTRNPLGTSGLPAMGEGTAADRISSPLPDVTGRERAAFARRRVLVVGAGHSAANTLISLADLAREEPDTRILWAVRGDSAAKVYGGGDADGLPARGQLGGRVRRLVEAGTIELHTGFGVARLKSLETGVSVEAADGRTLEADVVVPCTGFRPDLAILRELRLGLDPAVEAPTELGPLIDPEFHSCGTVQPHGAKLLAHPEKGFYIVGMKSYGRAPTFLLATGYEQVRSVAAALAGDQGAADTVHLELPETGVCSTDAGSSCDVPAAGAPAAAEDAGCCAEPEPVLLGFPTGLAHGRSSTLLQQTFIARKTPAVLFVCSRNGGKSQLAAGLMRHLAGNAVTVFSAGTKPAAALNSQAVESLTELGVDVTGEHPKPVTDDVLATADVVIVLGTEAKLEPREGTRYEVWETDEPSERGIDGMERMRLVRDDIKARVQELHTELTRN